MLVGSASEATGSLFSSPIFRIYAESSKKEFTAHAKTLAKSPILRKIVEGDWKDSSERTVNLEEWDQYTIHRLLDWLYTGDYSLPATIPQPCLNQNSKVETGEDTTQNQDIPVLDNGEKTPRDLAVTDLGAETNATERSSDMVTCRPLSPKLVDLPNVEDARHHAIEIGCTLLLHAKIYALAQYLQLTDLKNLAISNIEDITTSAHDLEAKPLFLKNIVDLVRYIYTKTDSLNNSKEPLRHLVSTFTATWLHAFEGSHVEALVAEGGDFAVDLMVEVQQRFRDMKAEHVVAEEVLKSDVKRYKRRLVKRGGKVGNEGGK